MEKELHVVFGAGQVGAILADILLSSGKRVRMVKRSQGIFPAGIELMLGDATDATFCHRACMDATAVYHCMNPEYSAKAWAETLPRYTDNLIAAAGGIGARLVVLDNLYMLGRTAGKPMNENTPSNPCSKKGEIRARLAERLFDAHRQGTVRTVCGRAADFYGPRGKLTFFGDFFWKSVLSGKAAISPVNPNVIHTYHYIPDVAQGLAALGCADESALGQVWMLPCQPAVTTRELAARFQPYLGQSIQMKAMPRWLLKSLGLFVPMIGELAEMAYQWDESFVVDDCRFRAHFDVCPVAVEEAARATVDWARMTYTS
ncbi:MAG: NAD-dependent epimerase/dehydratase family protein [Methylobacter sp.]|nr:NAD-dependent epimerase/dehydratase family protein [Methylobacter sp.]